jgi:CDP-diacylglycerol--glycerol-3-phosphate 3-phosphatidyltransferase
MTGPQQRILSPLVRKCRLLDAARGLLLAKEKTKTEQLPLPLPTFALQSHHFGNLLSASPSEFHSTLCDRIRDAKHRVSLASLYIGPAATPNHTQEEELLQALSQVSTNVDVQIVLDQNRALRPVPTTTNDGMKTTTSSAQAVATAIQQQQPSSSSSSSPNPRHSLHLCQVLPSPLDAWLPNPLNEVAGVFHIKAYIVDDTLILSGANLSEEYFSDRHDRYLMICKGGNGLVDFYAQLIDVLCQHSEQYTTTSMDDGDDACGGGGDGDGATDKKEKTNKSKPTSQQDFSRDIASLFTDTDPTSAEDLWQDPETVAVCVPTFHHPQGAASSTSTSILSDVDALLALLNEGVRDDNDDGTTTTTTTSIQLSSAYLNPTKDLVQALSKYAAVDLVTAGRLSHGFRPKPSATGNKGKDWIPTVFDHLAVQTLADIPHAKLHHWQRPDWSFHAKGLWMQEHTQQQQQQQQQNLLLAAVVGSSNFGGRSFERDMESNVILLFNNNKDQHEHDQQQQPASDIAKSLQAEWEQLLESSQTNVDPRVVLETAPPLPLHIRSLLPYIKSFF